MLQLTGTIKHGTLLVIQTHMFNSQLTQLTVISLQEFNHVLL